MDYYSILGVPHNATDEEIKQAYRNMLKAFHPVYYSGDKEFAERKTRELIEAHSVLGNASKRAAYDKQLENVNVKEKKPVKHYNFKRSKLLAIIAVTAFIFLLPWVIQSNPTKAKTDKPSKSVTSTVSQQYLVCVAENGTRYHRLDCQYVQGKTNLKYFKTIELVEKRGYKPCSVCNP